MLQIEPVYASPNGIPLRYDFIRPASNTPSPLIVFIHGGGWISGDKADLGDVASSFVQKGYAAALIQYRLAPLHPFPAAIEDVQAFVRYAREHAGELGIDPKRIASLGSSAGGHLAAMAGVTDAVVGGTSSRVNVVVDYCGLTDLRDYRDHHYPISWSFLEQFLPEPYEGNNEMQLLASPIALVTAASVPTFIAHSEQDDIVPISQSESFASALNSNKVPCRFLRVPGHGHGFTLEAWPSVEIATLEFLKEHL